MHDLNGGMAGFGYPGGDTTLGDLFGSSRYDSGSSGRGPTWLGVLGLVLICAAFVGAAYYTGKYFDARKERRIEKCMKETWPYTRSWCETSEDLGELK